MQVQVQVLLQVQSLITVILFKALVPLAALLLAVIVLVPLLRTPPQSLLQLLMIKHISTNVESGAVLAIVQLLVETGTTDLTRQLGYVLAVSLSHEHTVKGATRDIAMMGVAPAWLPFSLAADRELFTAGWLQRQMTRLWCCGMKQC